MFITFLSTFKHPHTHTQLQIASQSTLHEKLSVCHSLAYLKTNFICMTVKWPLCLNKHWIKHNCLLLFLLRLCLSLFVSVRLSLGQPLGLSSAFATSPCHVEDGQPASFALSLSFTCTLNRGQRRSRNRGNRWLLFLSEAAREGETAEMRKHGGKTPLHVRHHRDSRQTCHHYKH